MTAAEILLLLLRASICKQTLSALSLEGLEESVWQSVLKTAHKQGVTAICYPTVQGLTPQARPPKKIMITWAYLTQAVEKRYRAQEKVLELLVHTLHAAHIPFYIIKGESIGRFYPFAPYRDSCDIDIYTGAYYERANRALQEAGFTFRKAYYKHAHLVKDNVLVENHQFCLEVRGRKSVQRTESYLQQLLPAPVTDTPPNPPFPPPMFTALLLIAHGASHFISDRLTLRQICDWAVLLNAQGQDLDKDALTAMIRDCGLFDFAAALTHIAMDYLGTDCAWEPVFPRKHALETRLLFDMLEASHVSSPLHASGLTQRWMQLRQVVQNRWKYRMFGESLPSVLAGTFKAHLLNKEPLLTQQ